MTIEVLQCPHCAKDVEANTGHDYGVCFHCYREFPIREALKLRQTRQILSETPAMIHMIGKSEAEVERRMKECFADFARTFRTEDFDEGIRCASMLLGMAAKPEQKYETTLRIEEEGTAAAMAFINNAYLEILKCKGRYNDEMDQIRTTVFMMKQEEKALDRAHMGVASAIAGAMNRSAMKGMAKETNAIAERENAEVSAMMAKATEDSLGLYIKLSNIISTAGLLNKIAGLDYDLQMNSTDREAFEEMYESTYGRFKATMPVCTEACNEAWPDLPAEIAGWRIEQREADGAILVRLLRTAHEKVRTILYTIEPLDANFSPLLPQPLEWEQCKYEVHIGGRVSSTNETCTLPPIHMQHAAVRIRRITMADGTEHTAGTSVPVNPPPLPDNKLQPALTAVGGKGATCLPYREGAWWRCICGKYNPLSRGECLCCKKRQDDTANLATWEGLREKAREMRVEEENTLVKAYEYKGLSCRHFSTHYTYDAREGSYDASEPLQAWIGEDLPVCAALDERWFAYIDARSGKVSAIDLSSGAKLQPDIPQAWDMAYEDGLIWACGEELTAYSLKTGRGHTVYPDVRRDRPSTRAQDISWIPSAGCAQSPRAGRCWCWPGTCRHSLWRGT